MKMIYTLERSNRKSGLNKIIVKHVGIEKIGVLSNAELLDIAKIIKKWFTKDCYNMQDHFMLYPCFKRKQH